MFDVNSGLICSEFSPEELAQLIYQLLVVGAQEAGEIGIQLKLEGFGLIADTLGADESISTARIAGKALGPRASACGAVLVALNAVSIHIEVTVPAARTVVFGGTLRAVFHAGLAFISTESVASRAVGTRAVSITICVGHAAVALESVPSAAGFTDCVAAGCTIWHTFLDTDLAI